MGWLTQRTFREGGVQTEVMKNVVVQTPTGDMLVNQMRSGSLDAAVAYLSNAAGSAEFLDAIRIQGFPCSVATQPFGVAKDSKNKRLTERLLQAIRADASQAAVHERGFPLGRGEGEPLMNDASAVTVGSRAASRGTRPVPTRRSLSRSGALGGSYVLLIVAMLAADLAFTSPNALHAGPAQTGDPVRHAADADHLHDLGAALSGSRRRWATCCRGSHSAAGG